MPEFNLIQRPDLILRLQQMLGLRQAHVTPSLSETVSPVVIMGDVRDTGGERQIVRPAWGFDSINPAPALFSTVDLLNPTGSGTIVTVREVRVSNATAAAAQQFSMFVRRSGASTLANPAAFPPRFRHSRAIDPLGIGQFNVPIAVLSHENLAPQASAYVLKSPGTTEVGTTATVVLTPGFSLRIQNDLVNQGMGASFVWEEEDLEQRS